MKRTFITLLATLCFAPHPLAAQNAFEEFRKQKVQEFNQYRDSKRETFETYRAQKNQEFAEYLSQKWASYELTQGKPQPKQPDPVTPTVAPKEEQKPTQPIDLPFGEVISTPRPTAPKPIDFPVEPAPQKDKRTSFTFYGTPCKVYFTPDMRFSLDKPSEKEVARIWKTLSGEGYTLLLADCRELHEKLQLNDFGLLLLAETIARQTIGTGNAATILQAYILTQFGYDIRLCQQGSKLGLMVPFKQIVCNTSYCTLNGRNFFVWDKDMRNGTVNSYAQNIKEATRQIDLGIYATPKFATSLSPARTFTATAYPSASVEVQVNKNLMNFYNDYPMMQDWGVYAAQAMDPLLTQPLYSRLKSTIKGKSETEAAGLLLNFVQTAFQYETDDKQFGKEKYNFGEENFYYKACDCEDRSILYSHLVRELLGPDVVLLYYPNHLATAVRFNQTVNGNALNINGQRYTICDPTYINAGIGMCMKQFIGVKPTVYRIGTGH